MHRIVTRGFGKDHLIITRGYGVSKLVEQFREVMRLVSRVTKNLLRVSKWKKTDCV